MYSLLLDLFLVRHDTLQTWQVSHDTEGEDEYLTVAGLYHMSLAKIVLSRPWDSYWLCMSLYWQFVTQMCVEEMKDLDCIIVHYS